MSFHTFIKYVFSKKKVKEEWCEHCAFAPGLYKNVFSVEHLSRKGKYMPKSAGMWRLGLSQMQLVLKMTLIQGLLYSGQVPRLQGGGSGSHSSSPFLPWHCPLRGCSVIWAKKKEGRREGKKKRGREDGMGWEAKASALLSSVRGVLGLQNRGHLKLQVEFPGGGLGTSSVFNSCLYETGPNCL